jgi:hypothetical protein
MAELQPETVGSPYAAEFGRMLASDMPLADVVHRWNTMANAYLSAYPTSLEALESLSDAEGDAYILGKCKGWDTYTLSELQNLKIDHRATDFHSLDLARESLARLEKARAALRSQNS